MTTFFTSHSGQIQRHWLCRFSSQKQSVSSIAGMIRATKLAATAPTKDTMSGKSGTVKDKAAEAKDKEEAAPISGHTKTVMILKQARDKKTHQCCVRAEHEHNVIIIIT
jgi:hypothetical protein